MPKKTDPKDFIEKPVLRGGEKAFKKLVKENLVYPELALKHKIEGTVKIKYDVSGNGKVLRPKVVSGIGYGCDEEAVRLVKMMKYSRVNNIKVNITIHQEAQVHFKLPKAKPAPTKSVSPQSGMKVTYSIVKKKPSESTPEPEKKPNTYGYTIRWNK